ncbi:ATP-binding cassette domain-containing protein [Dactylosporangium aurantiacum]|uniref:ATP-binding cassette domain-containing protein n=1 Tax=Dactylosporangium aurantiacum TaxID=35754 RepID=A0A9Q9MD93_9ACTN|nr:ATP-binding cassette domain-containing protein [Dactylosporangium aurantiacum]MDG6101117.1 ATP-binding cassette domain-containing protein [Dactylosporangium aurantiacum]UWZ54848.1 ATP-binding cassette domain-containing protein [Dactylosporangium aurantiacum]
MISVNGITKSFGRRTLWSDVSFKVAQGQLHALVGPSGCGKSTLLNCLGLLEQVDSGSILIADKDITKFGAAAQRRFRRDTLGYLFQNYALIDNATIAFNLAVAVGAAGRSRRQDAFEAALDRVGLGGRGKEMVYQLSGGEQQRVALARLMVKQPKVVLADEPTGALDSDNATMVINVLRRMAEDGCAVVIATHSKHVETSCDTTLLVGGAH